MTNRYNRLIAVLLILFLLSQNLSYLPVIAVGSDLLPNKHLAGTDFEDQDIWGFEPSEDSEVRVIKEDDNHYLEATSSGTDEQSVIVKNFDQPTTADQVLISFDWRPGEISAPLNFTEISFLDSNDLAIFRLIKKGGPDGQLLFDLGSSGSNISEATVIDGVPTDGRWLSVEVFFDFTNESVSIIIGEQNNSDTSVKIENIDIGHLTYQKQLKGFNIISNRANKQLSNFKMGFDNISINQAEDEELARPQEENKISKIMTEYHSELMLPLNHSFEDTIKLLPQQVLAELDNGSQVELGVEWSSLDYNPEQIGTYSFIGTLIHQDIESVKNDDQIQLEITVQVTENDQLPEVKGYQTLYYTDFGDTMEVTPVNWGFTTTNADLSINKEDLAGNDTNKLQFNIVDQSGGRVATKQLDTAIKGTHILTKFDWYPGEVNDKGEHLYENGGEIRLIDGSGNIVFTLNHTKNAPLSYFIGGQSYTAIETDFNDPETWYAVSIHLDLYQNTVTLELTDQESGKSIEDTLNLDNIDFDGSIEIVRLVGNRTSGNNLTWTTYLDNFGFYHKPIPEDTIIRVNPLPYQRVYVNETTSNLDSIGLPDSVTVILGDNSKTEVAIEKWKPEGKDWDPSKAGVYKFTGILAERDDLNNHLDRTATLYVYNRLTPPKTKRQTEWLDRGAVALKAEEGIFISWRLLVDEYSQDITFNIYRNNQLLNEKPLFTTNYHDLTGQAGDKYTIELLNQGKAVEETEVTALEKDYLSIPMQKPEGGVTATGEYTYSANDASVGDLDGDGEYEIVIKWDPSNAMMALEDVITGPTIFDAYKLDGTLMWRINMGMNLTSGPQYHQFVVGDLDGNGKSEFLIKSGDGTTVYGATNGKYDEDKIISQIGNPEDDGKWINEGGHQVTGPEYVSVFDGETGAEIDTIDFAFPVEKEEGDGGISWGDNFYNRSDRFLSALAYIDGKTPSAIYGRGYYERTAFVSYSLRNGKLVEDWTFDSDEAGRGESLGNHNLAVGDVDNDGFDEIIAGSLTLDHDGTILYAMDGDMGRVKGSHGDALHVGAFDPDREGLHVFGVREDPSVASLEYHDGATGETLKAFYAYKDAGRGVAANITTKPGYEFWGAGGLDAETGGGVYNVQGDVIEDSFRDIGLPVNFTTYWDGDLLHELLDHTSITKYDEASGSTQVIENFADVVSINGTKGNPSLQADILGDWREEAIYPTEDSMELRIFSTTIPTEYRLPTLMHDSVYRMGIAWQNATYNQPPHIGYYLGEDIRDAVLAGKLDFPEVEYTNQPVIDEPDPEEPDESEDPKKPGESEDPNELEDPKKPGETEVTKPPLPNDPKDPESVIPKDNPDQTLDGHSSKAESGKSLPVTATSQYKYLLIGLILSLAGLTLFIFKRRQLNKNNH